MPNFILYIPTVLHMKKIDISLCIYHYDVWRLTMYRPFNVWTQYRKSVKCDHHFQVLALEVRQSTCETFGPAALRCNKLSNSMWFRPCSGMSTPVSLLGTSAGTNCRPLRECFTLGTKSLLISRSPHSLRA